MNIRCQNAADPGGQAGRFGRVTIPLERLMTDKKRPKAAAPKATPTQPPKKTESDELKEPAGKRAKGKGLSIPLPIPGAKKPKPLKHAKPPSPAESLEAARKAGKHLKDRC